MTSQTQRDEPFGMTDTHALHGKRVVITGGLTKVERQSDYAARKAATAACLRPPRYPPEGPRRPTRP